MLTMPLIISRTPQQRVLDAGLVKIVEQKAGYLENGDVFFAAKTRSVRERLPNGNIIRLTGSPTYLTVIVLLNKRGHVQCSCSCGDFKYRWEVALERKDAAEIEYSNGQPPIYNNPQMIPSACKHLVKLYQVIKPRLSKVVDI